VNGVRACRMSALALCLLASGSAAARQSIGGSSDLARQNFDHISASASEIRTALWSDSGLMIALKRWIAKDASDHNQYVSDADLADEAIFERLESDLDFRAAATRLLQQYGYLLPKLNPGSDAAREKEMVLVERSKLLAQHQVEALTRAAEKGSDNPREQESVACVNDPGGSCDTTQAPTNARENNHPAIPQGEPQIGNVPGEERPAGTPRSGEPALLRAETNGAGTTSGALDAAQSSEVYGPRVPITNISLNRQGAANSDDGSPLLPRSTEGFPSAAFPGMKSQNDGLLASYGAGFGNGLGSEFAETGTGGGQIGAGGSPELKASPGL
jgi:hypothetical protein